MIYPTVYFSELGFKEIREQKHGIRDLIALHTSLADVRIWLRTDGYLVLDTEDTNIATELCNCLFLSLSLLGRSPVLPVVGKEFDEATLSDDSQRIRLKKGSLVGLRNLFTFYDEVRDDIDNTHVGSNLIVYKSSQARIAIELAEKFFQSKHKSGILTFYECFSAFDRGDWTTSLLLGWISVEMMLYEELHLHLGQQGVYEALVKRIEKKWFIRMVLDFLLDETRAKRFTQEKNPMRFGLGDLEECHELRKIRNKVVHKGYRSDMEEAGKSKSLAERALWRFMRIGGIDYNSHLDRMREIYHEQGLITE